MRHCPKFSRFSILTPSLSIVKYVPQGFVRAEQAVAELGLAQLSKLALLDIKVMLWDFGLDVQFVEMFTTTNIFYLAGEKVVGDDPGVVVRVVGELDPLRHGVLVVNIW